MSVIFALVTSIALGFDSYFVKRGLIETPNPIIAAFITLTINFALFVSLSIIFSCIISTELRSVYFFILAGFLAPGLGRLLSYKGFESLGITTTVPILNCQTLFTVATGVIFLGEPINFFLSIGIVSVVCGVIVLGYESGQKEEFNIDKRFPYRYLFYPIAASVCYGVSMFFRKMGLNLVNSPILGATLTSGTSWLIVTISLVGSGNLKRLTKIKKRSLMHFMIAGGATCIGWFSLFNALSIGKLIVVGPIISTYSLVTLILSFFLLRNVERITFKMLMATILIVAGVVILLLSK